MFKSELEMSKKFEKFIKVNFGKTYIKEYQGLFGIPDFVFYSKVNNNISIISFELKLKNWKKAAMQAFRYRSFSNASYVVLSSSNINSAINNIELFKQYKIGLAKFDDIGIFEILYKPELCLPFSEILNLKIIQNINSRVKYSKNIEIFI